MQKQENQNFKEFKQFAITNRLSNLTRLFKKGIGPEAIEELKLHQSGIQAIPTCFKCLTSLKTIYLRYNFITKIENLQTLTSLRFLELLGNQIKKIENLETLVSLTQLDLRNNQITKIDNLETLTTLTQLSLSHNQITTLQTIWKPSATNFFSLKSLKKLYLGHNLIMSIEGILHIEMPNLTDLLLSDNKISNFDALRRANLPQIQVVGIYGNKTDQHNSFKELKCQRIRVFYFGEYNSEYQQIQGQVADRNHMLIFKMESQLTYEKQRIWKQYKKRENRKYHLAYNPR